MPIGPVACGVSFRHRLAEHDELAAVVAARFEQDRVHHRFRLDAAGLRLGRLRPADLLARQRHEGVQRHVLGLERRDG